MAEHVPALQTWPAPQAFPHAPQSAALLVRSTQTPLHAVCPAGQAQAPFAQMAPMPHVAPQAPQFAGSVFVFVQRPRQAVSPMVQLPAQWAALHTWPALHTLPHAPQSFGLLATSTHTPE